MPATGSMPGKGVYQCIRCGNLVRLKDSDEVLTICPQCGGTNYNSYYLPDDDE